jgi:hypothetical protein
VLRAGRDSPLRAEAIGIDLRGFQWMAPSCSPAPGGPRRRGLRLLQGLASRPSSISIAQSTDGLVMVLLGGVETLTGPVVGAAIFTWLRDALAARTEFWRAVLGLVILADRRGFPAGTGRRSEGARRALAAGMSEAVLQVDGLHKAFGGVQAVEDVSFAGLGRRAAGADRPNGAGKSTCFNMLNGQLAPDSGIARLERQGHRRPEPARDLAARCRPHLPDHRDLLLLERARKRTDGPL